MSLATEDEPHECPESVYRFFMEQLIWLEREAIQEGNVGDNSYWQLDEAVARKSILKISQIRLVEQR
jgi:hypothetical protein